MSDGQSDDSHQKPDPDPIPSTPSLTKIRPSSAAAAFSREPGTRGVSSHETRSGENGPAVVRLATTPRAHWLKVHTATRPSPTGQWPISSGRHLMTSWTVRSSDCTSPAAAGTRVADERVAVVSVGRSLRMPLVRRRCRSSPMQARADEVPWMGRGDFAAPASQPAVLRHRARCAGESARAIDWQRAWKSRDVWAAALHSPERHSGRGRAGPHRHQRCRPQARYGRVCRRHGCLLPENSDGASAESKVPQRRQLGLYPAHHLSRHRPCVRTQQPRTRRVT